MAKSRWLETHYLNVLFIGGSLPTVPSTWYVGLFSTSPVQGNDAAGVELSGNGYARGSIVRDSNHFAQAAQIGSDPDYSTNLVIVNMFTATGTLPTAVAFGLFDALTGGNLWYWGPANAPSGITIISSNKVSIPIGALLIKDT